MTTTTTYFSRIALEQLAQAELYDHLLGDAGGRCRACGETEPCRRRITLVETILACGCLPQRRPGLTRRLGRRSPSIPQRATAAPPRADLPRSK
jgi:hypothetical protein